MRTNLISCHSLVMADNWQDKYNGETLVCVYVRGESKGSGPSFSISLNVTILDLLMFQDKPQTLLVYMESIY